MVDLESGTTTAHASTVNVPGPIRTINETQAGSTGGKANELSSRDQHDEGGKPSKEVSASRYGGTHEDPNFPDGGWRAWLVIFG
ncbi:hypothetical protein DXG03_006391, partial [Asterophora parasitica]